MIIAETGRQALKDAGIEPDRMVLEWASAAEAPRFVKLITGYVSDIKSLGPLGTAPGEESKDGIRRHLSASVRAASGRKVRTALGKLAKDMRKSGDYSMQLISERVAKKVFPVFRQERLAQEIGACLAEQGASDKEDLCRDTRGTTKELDKIIETLSQKGLVHQEGTDRYKIGDWEL